MKVFQNTVNRYHCLSIGKYSPYYEEIDKKYFEVQFSYKGVFDDSNMFFINSYIESISVKDEGDRPDLFRIFVELAQNIAQNSIDKVMYGDKPVGCGMMIIFEQNEYYEIIAGNPAHNRDIEKLKTKINTINNLDEEGLRDLKRQYRSMEQGEMGNANIGLIKTALISKNKIILEEVKIDDESTFFTLTIKISK